ncbi:hypothetical protein JCM6882_006574 [Rhodosporidiobolus microsporus]
MSFHPPLATTTFIPLPSSSTPSSAAPYSQTLHFTYLPSATAPLPADATPEVWTNLPRGDGEWHALALSATHGSKLYTAQVDLSRITAPASFEYTYRLSHPAAGGEGVTWLGSAGGNGRVEVVAAAPPHLSVPALIAENLEEGTGPGRWEEVGEGVAVGKFGWGEGRDGGAVETFDVSGVVELAGGSEGAEGGWKDGEGVVWEQSSRSWLVPRQLSAPNPLSSLSPTHPAQLLILRSTPSAAHPLPRTLVLFPFSTREVCSTLTRGSTNGDTGKLLLQCERDAPPLPGAKKAEGHLAVAWGHEGSPPLGELVASCVAAARSVLLDKPYEAPATAREEEKAAGGLAPPRPLGLCTWNALSNGGETQYTLSDVLAWLDGLNLAGISALHSSPSSGSGSSSGAAALSPAHGAVKSLLLDDGWQDTATYTDLSDGAAGGEGADALKHAERRALRSFGVRRGWYDLATAAPSASASAAPSRPETPTPGGGNKQSRARSDSGYGRSPDLSRSLASIDPEDLDAAREGVCAELCDAVRRVRERGVERVGVWVTVFGYWHGLHPDGALADAYTLRLTTLRSSIDPSYSLKVYLPAPSDLPTFYRDYFASLRAAGIDFVKVDDQAAVDAIVEQEGGENDEGEEEWTVEPGELKHLVLESMRSAAVEVFGPHGHQHGGQGETSGNGVDAAAVETNEPFPALINCMAGSPRVWGGSLGVLGLPLDRTSSSSSSPSSSFAPTLIRTSDDFFPAVADSHRWHLYHNALTSLFASALRFAPCFDMAQANHPWGEAHLALRAFSSAPVWATDAPPPEDGEDGAEKKLDGWAPLVATTKAGLRVVQARAGAGSVLEGALTADVVGQSSSGAADAQPLKVGLALPHAKGTHLGLWNCLADGKGGMEAVVDAKDLGDALGGAVEASAAGGGASVVVFSASAGEGGAPFVQEFTAAELDAARSASRALAAPLKQALYLPSPGSVEVLTLAQVFPLGAVKVACLGLLDKTVGLAAVRSVKFVGRSGVSTPKEPGEEETPSSPSLTAATESKLATPSSLDSPLPSPTPSPASRALSSTFPAAPSSPRSTSPRPIPQARLPFLLAYLTGFLRHTPLTSASQPQQQQRTPSTELRSLLHDLFRRPFRTAWTEVGAVFSFGFAAVVWALGGRGGVKGGSRQLVGGEGVEQRAEEGSAAEVEDALSDEKERLEVLLDFVSPRLGFYVSPASAGASLRFKLDGKEVEERFVAAEGAAEGKVVEVDAEGAWRAAGRREEEGKEARPWRLTVEVA